MGVFPVIELHKGLCVSLHRGRLEEPQSWHVNPVKKARDWAAAGAEMLHLTDFDAVEGNPDVNRALVTDIIRKAGIPVQFGGGLPNIDVIRHWIDDGASRLALSSAASPRPDVVKQAARRWPGQLGLSVHI